MDYPSNFNNFPLWPNDYSGPKEDYDPRLFHHPPTVYDEGFYTTQSDSGNFYWDYTNYPESFYYPPSYYDPRVAIDYGDQSNGSQCHSSDFTPISKSSTCLELADRNAKKQINNIRERSRVHDINSAFEELGRLCNILPAAMKKPKTSRKSSMSKLNILQESVTLISYLEDQVRGLRGIIRQPSRSIPGGFA